MKLQVLIRVFRDPVTGVIPSALLDMGSAEGNGNGDPG